MDLEIFIYKFFSSQYVPVINSTHTLTNLRACFISNRRQQFCLKNEILLNKFHQTLLMLRDCLIAREQCLIHLSEITLCDRSGNYELNDDLHQLLSMSRNLMGISQIANIASLLGNAYHKFIDLITHPFQKV